MAEGRESGTVGLYDADGSVREDLLDELASSAAAGRIIYEAPQRSQQAHLIRRLGPEVNLGNIALDDVMGLETLRLGLRSDTIGLGAELGSRPVRTDGRAATGHGSAAPNVVPSRYRQVAVAAVPSLDPDWLAEHFTGREVYFRTRFIVARQRAGRRWSRWTEASRRPVHPDRPRGCWPARTTVPSWSTRPSTPRCPRSWPPRPSAPGARCVIVEGRTPT